MRQRLKCLVLALLLTLIGLGTWVVYESTAIVLEHIEVNIANLPTELDGYTIVHLSDFHGRELSSSGKLLDRLRNARPDIIALTGDYVDHSIVELDGVLPFVTALTTIAPVYAVSGNHDYWTNWEEIAAQLRATGIDVLENEHRVLSHQGASLVVAGVNDPYTGHGDLPSALEGAPLAPVVLLAHAPTWFEARKQYLASTALENPSAIAKALKRVDLTLAGHTHGGQIKLPFIGALSNASGRIFPRDYVEGLTFEGSGWLYISRGIGYTTLPVRFLSKAQVTVLTLRTK